MKGHIVAGDRSSGKGLKRGEPGESPVDGGSGGWLVGEELAGPEELASSGRAESC